LNDLRVVMANNPPIEEYEKNVKEAKRFAAMLLEGSCDTFDLEQFEIMNMYSSMLELTPEELEAEEGITKSWLLSMVEELREMLERTIIANAAKTGPGELFYWMDDFAGTDGYHDWCASLASEEE